MACGRSASGISGGTGRGRRLGKQGGRATGKSRTWKNDGEGGDAIGTSRAHGGCGRNVFVGGNTSLASCYAYLSMSCSSIFKLRHTPKPSRSQIHPNLLTQINLPPKGQIRSDSLTLRTVSQGPAIIGTVRKTARSTRTAPHHASSFHITRPCIPNAKSEATTKNGCQLLKMDDIPSCAVPPTEGMYRKSVYLPLLGFTCT